MSEQTCTESAPCFACLRCTIRLLNLIPEAARKADAAIPSADGGGQWTPDPEKPDHYTFGPLDAERTIALTAASVATIPTGERVELPAGTVLREGTLPPDAEDDRPTLGEQIHEEHERTQ